MQFRDAVDADAPVLAALVHSAYRGDSSRTGWTSEADLLDGDRISVEDVRALVADPDTVVLIGLDDDRSVLACCELRRTRPGVGYFGMFAVRPGRTGGGVGRTVMAEAERVAVDRFAVRSLEMSVIAQRAELIAWYERLGYTRTGETLPFPYGEPKYGAPQRDDLHFVVLAKPLGDATGSGEQGQQQVADGRTRQQ